MKRSTARSAVIFAAIFVAVTSLGMLFPEVAASRAATPQDGKPALPAPDSDGWIALFNGTDLSGWTLKNPNAKKTWVVCPKGVKLDPNDATRLVRDDQGNSPQPVYLSGDDGRGSDLLTAHDFYDYELHLEFTVSKGSNSGVYNRGLYEIQIFDSFGAKQLEFHDCGSLYERARPKVNVAKAPGEWQTFDIKMSGRQISLVWNGAQIYKDLDVRYGETDKAAFERLMGENASQPPELQVKLEEKDGKYVGFFGNGGTRASLPGADRAGPILLQGDHGPVAYRNIKIRPIKAAK
jgi:hypothetical protein